MIDFICPVCKKHLKDEGALFRCENRHSFDKSKFGYVNLLMSNSSSLKRHGDDRIMIRARKGFLSNGYYSFLRDKISEICAGLLTENADIIDAGCGTCYYSAAVSERLTCCNFAGIDISKDALEYASRQGIKFPLCVASAYNMPFESSSADCILSIFSPDAYGEYQRVLKNGGYLIKAVPLENHLFSLKELIYDDPYLNPAPETKISGFETADFIRLEREIFIDNAEDISNLFKMTPYYYKTSRENQQKLEKINELTTTAAFGILVLKARKSDE